MDHQSENAAEKLATLSIHGGGESSVKTLDKDPRRIARKYQIDLCQKALRENTIAYLGTGSGKTHVSVMLIYEMRHLIKKPQKDICVFLAPTVALVEQQTKVIQESVDVKVGVFTGTDTGFKDHHEWEKEMAKYEVLVMTPQILVHYLSHCFIRMEQIVLLIFDECHYAQLHSSHPYAEIMKVFYRRDALKLPRIFGMTASPKLGKDASINGLETLLRAKVYTVDDKEELAHFVTSPKVKMYHYTNSTSSASGPIVTHYQKLEEIRYQCVQTLNKSMEDHKSLISAKKILQRLHDNLVFCLEQLGLWGQMQATQILLKGDSSERNQLMEMEGQSSDDDSICNRYLAQVATIFASDSMKDGTKAELTGMEVLPEPFFSTKLIQLIHILTNFRSQPNMKCIVFVNRIITVRPLLRILRNLEVLSSWKCDFLIGVNSGLEYGSRKNTNVKLEKFRSGELNLLVATKVGEEGLDIQTCCLVIRFDLPETLASFIQSRGRARMPQSEYALLVNSGDKKEMALIQSFERGEHQMNEEIEYRTSTATFDDLEVNIYKVDSTGATISATTSISLLHHYCARLPHDEFFNPTPKFSYFDYESGTVCKIILPSNAPMHEIASSPQSSKEAAKKDACLKACGELHQLGALTNYLLPEQDFNEESDSSDSNSSDDEDSRRELHEILVPAALKEPWSNTENSVCLSSYFVRFSPHPADRDYRPFGLFVKLPLPEETERMKLDLNLSLGRSVTTELVPSTAMKFDKDEIVLAEKFQEMFLKAIIDRSEFIPEFVSLGKNDYGNSGPRTFYLLLPVIWRETEETMTIDWNLIRRCLSSQIFRTPKEAGDNGLPPLTNYLHLANGPESIDNIVNSLVYAPCKDLFFFVSDVVSEKNAYSNYKESRTYEDHFFEMFSIRLSHPNQPLLRVKQLFRLGNLLRRKGNSEVKEKEEHFFQLPPEIFQLKVIGFSKDIGSSISLLPSIMHRLECMLVAIELKNRLSSSFPEGAEVSTSRILEALTTERCGEHFSLERLEVLGDAFLKYAVGRHLFLSHDTLDEGQLTRRRSNITSNANLCKLATRSSLQVYMRDLPLEPSQLFALGRSCKVVCKKETEKRIHSKKEVRCQKSHHWLYKKNVADMVEGLIGAFIVDGGFKAAIAFLHWIGIQVDFDSSKLSNIILSSTSGISLSSRLDISALEKLIGYQFIHKSLLLQAFIHPSYNHHTGGCYQRLEFIGDAVLDYLITSYLYSAYPNLNPGQLTDLRSMYISNNCLADIAVNHSFHKFIICDSNALRKSMDKYVEFTKTSSVDEDLVEAPKFPKALSDLVESCVGAILLDTGFNLNRVWKTMLSFLEPVMSFSRIELNPLREIVELCQSHNWDLEFVATLKDKIYTVEAKVNGKDVSVTACATNHSKKAAKRTAAKQVLSTLKEQGYKPKTKMLEDIVKLTRKMEAKLIGYDEIPADVIAPSVTGFVENSNASSSGHSSNVHPISAEPTKVSDSWTAGGSIKKTAKSRLFEFCAVNCLANPIFTCYNERGPDHLKEFTYKVVVEIEEPEGTIIEAVGYPSSKKKDAGETAAQGALWYLKQEGYFRV